jgi:hypothetical protein
VRSARKKPWAVSWDSVFRQREQVEKRFYEVVERFRQKGALSPETAMTPEELNLPPRFETAMKRRLGNLGIFVEVNGKYYLSEDRLKQIEETRSARDVAHGPGRAILRLRTIQMVAIGLFLALLVANLFIESWQLRVISIIILAVWLVISVLQIYYLTRIRQRARTPPSQIKLLIATMPTPLFHSSLIIARSLMPFVEARTW